MPEGTTNGAATKTVDDAVLTQALSEMQAEGFDPSAPVNSEPPQDEPADSAGTNPSVESQGAHDPGEDGEPGQEDNASTDAQQSNAPADPNSQPQEQDPLAGTEPFTFDVDGEQKTLEGVYRVPGEGLLVPEEQVPKFQLMASRAETLERSNRDLYQRSQEYERLTSWKVKGQDGTERFISGAEGLAEQRALLSRSLAGLQLLNDVFEKGSPLSFIATDEQGNITWNPEALATLSVRLENAGIKAEQAARSTLQSLITEASKPKEPDAREVAPAVVDQYAKALNAGSLTAEDRALLTEMVPRFVRKATEEDVRENPQFKLGQTIVDKEFGKHVLHYNGLRVNSQKVTTANDKATSFNNGQKKGLQSKPKTVNTQKVNTTPEPKRGKEEAWQKVFEDSMREIGVAS